MQFLYFCNCHPTFFIALLFSVSFFNTLLSLRPSKKTINASVKHLRNVLKMSTHFTHVTLYLLPFSLSRLSLSYYIIILYLLFRKMVLKYHLDFKTVISISFDSTKHTHQIWKIIKHRALRPRPSFLLKT